MRISIEVPFFPGFYESPLEDSDTPYWAIKDDLEYYTHDLREEHPEYQSLTEDDLDFDYDEYRKDVIKGYIEGFANLAPDFIENVEFDEMTSPKYYNFATDRLFAFMDFTDGWEDKVRAFMSENHDWLKERIKEDWTSYDGFASFMSNNFDDTAHDEDDDYWGDKSWYFHLFSGKSDRYECYLSCIITYMMYRKNKNVREELYQWALEDVSACMYVFITDEAKERIQKDIDEGRVVLPDPDQLELPLSE